MLDELGSFAYTAAKATVGLLAWMLLFEMLPIVTAIGTGAFLLFRSPPDGRPSLEQSQYVYRP